LTTINVSGEIAFHAGVNLVTRKKGLLIFILAALAKILIPTLAASNYNLYFLTIRQSAQVKIKSRLENKIRQV